MKAKLVIFEGCDGSGKTTIYQAFRRATAYQILCIDRFIGSQLVYDEIYGREDKRNQWFQEEEKLQEVYDVYLVVMTAPLEVIRDRIREKERGNDFFLAWRNCQQADFLFRRYLETTRIQKNLLMDSSRPLEECLDALMAFVGEPYVSDPGREKMAQPPAASSTGP